MRFLVGAEDEQAAEALRGKIEEMRKSGGAGEDHRPDATGLMKHRNNNWTVSAAWALLTAAVWICLGTGTAWGAEGKKLKDGRFSMGLGAGFVRFDTNFKFTDKGSGLSAFVDAEGTLGLPESETVGVIYGRYRFSKKHALGFSTFRVRRENALFADHVNLGDWTITGTATLTDNTSFYFLNYSYTFMQDERARVFGSFGLYGLDLSYRLDLFGNIEYQGEPLDEDTYEAEASVFAPLPMFGVDAVFALTSKWWLSTRITMVGGSHQDISAGILDTSVRSGFEFSKHVGVVLGIEYFSASVTIDSDDLKTDVSYGFDGVFLGLTLRF